MKPILYPPEERDFNNNGLGVLSDAISCVVTWEANGVYDLTMEYPMDGIHFEKITDRCIIMAIPTPYREAQPFRIAKITTVIDGTATIYAQHVAYDLAGIPLNPFSADNAPAAMAGLESNAEAAPGFTFWTDKDTTARFSVALPTSIWSVLGGSEGSILDVYGGQYEFDRWTIKLHDHLGQDNGVTIRYGKNMTDLEQERNLAYMYTGVYPYWADGEGQLVTCDPKIVPIEGQFSHTNVLTLDLSSEWEEAPTPEQLRTRAERYIKDNSLGQPRVSITVSHEMLEQTDEYAGLSLLERCSVFDTVTVQFEKLGVDVKATISAAETDVLLEKYNSLKVGSVQASIADTINGQQSEIQKRPVPSEVKAIANAIATILLGASGGCIRFLDTDGDEMPDTLYMADKPNPAEAKKVWRFNYEGWGASSNGYNGPFEMSAALGVGMYADFIAAGTLDASLINVVNLVAQGVELTGNFKTTYGDLTAEMWAGVIKLMRGDVELVGLSSGSGTTQGIVNVWDNGEVKTQIFGGNVVTEYLTVKNNMNTKTASVTGQLTVGEAITAGKNVTTKQAVCFNACRPRDGTNTLMTDWKRADTLTSSDWVLVGNGTAPYVEEAADD